MLVLRLRVSLALLLPHGLGFWLFLPLCIAHYVYLSQEGAGASVLSAYVEIVFDNSDKRIDVSLPFRFASCFPSRRPLGFRLSCLGTDSAVACVRSRADLRIVHAWAPPVTDIRNDLHLVLDAAISSVFSNN